MNAYSRLIQGLKKLPGHERADIGPENVDLRPKRADLRRLIWG